MATRAAVLIDRTEAILTEEVSMSVQCFGKQASG